MALLKLLFESIKIGKLNLKNRIVFPAMRTNYAMKGVATKRMIDYYVERAKGGVGLIIVEATYPHFHGLRPGVLRVDDNKFIPKLRALSEAIKNNGARVAIQFNHAGREWAGPNPIAPSAVPSHASEVFTHAGGPRQKPRALSVEEIKKIVKAYGDGARRVKEAGFEAVEIHGAHGYLVHQFLSPLVNKRDDEYGGDVCGRTRFAVEIIRQIKDEAGSDFPVILRMSGDEYAKGGITLAESTMTAKILEENGANAIHVSGGSYENRMALLRVIPYMAFPRGCFVHLAEKIKKAVHIPTIVVGRINDPVLAEQILQEGKADLIAMGRPLLADPELPKKAKEGRFDDILPCMACCQGCVDRLFSVRGIQCTINATVGRDKQYKLRTTKHPKKVVIVGGGPGGMEAARVAALRGHNVVLLEKKFQLGGNFLLAAMLSYKKDDVTRFIGYLERQIKKLRVEVRLGEEATPETIRKMKPDVVILAMGGIPIIPEALDVSKDNILTAEDALASKKKVGKKVVVVGAGLVGCETALFLAERKHEVTIISRRPEENLATDVVLWPRLFLLDKMAEYGIKVLGEVDVKESSPKDLTIVDKSGQLSEVAADTIVIARGYLENKKLGEKLKSQVKELYFIGDCSKPRSALEAIQEAVDVTYKI